MSRDASDDFAAITGNILFMTAMVLVLLVWALTKLGIDWVDHLTLLREAQSIFDQVRAEEMPDLQVDPMLQAIFGENIDLPSGGSSGNDDWLIQAIFNVT